MSLKKVSLILFFITSFASRSAVWTATACPATWGASPYPFWNGSTQLTNANISAGDVLVIPLGCSVSISGVVTMATDITLQINGALVFPTTGDKLNLTANSSIFASSTGSLVGVSNSNQIKIGTGGAEWSGPGTLPGPFVITNGFLPIELIAFTGVLEVKVVFLNWKTATESNNDYFEIEKSSDGVNFSSILKIDSKADNGNSNTQLEYSTIDNDLKHPLYYYRLKQVDFDGSSKRTNPITVKIYSPELKIYPNPNNGAFWIDVPTAKINQKVSVRIYDQLSNEVLSNDYNVVNDNITGASVKIEPKQPLARGAYMALINFEGTEFRLKMVVN